MLLCPVLFGLGTFAPQALGFLEPVGCPPGMRLDRVTETESYMGETAITLDAACADGRDRVDVTNRMSVFVCGLPVVGGVLFVVYVWFKPSKKEQESPHPGA